MKYIIPRPVVVNTGGEDAAGTVDAIDRKLGLFVTFENGTHQWMSPKFVKTQVGRKPGGES